MLFVTLLVLSIPALIGWNLYRGLRTGVIRWHGRWSREEHPGEFWYLVGGYGFLLFLFAMLFVIFAMDALG